MNLEIIGPRASGKTTLGNTVASEFNLEYVSFGKLARAEMRDKTALGKTMQHYMDSMEPYPPGFLQEFMLANLRKIVKTRDGFVLDGYPRRKNEAEELVEILKILNQPLDLLIELYLANSEVIKRAQKRLWCENCDFQDSDLTNNSLCPKCGCALKQRQDDDAEKLQKMNELYLREKDSVISILTLNMAVQLVKINASHTLPIVIQAALESIRNIHD